MAVKNTASALGEAVGKLIEDEIERLYVRFARSEATPTIEADHVLTGGGGKHCSWQMLQATNIDWTQS